MGAAVRYGRSPTTDVCGRFTLTSTPETLAERFALDAAPAWTPRYNVAPGQDVLAVRADAGRRAASRLRWGLVPEWATDPTIGQRLVNARIETAAARSAFRDALKRQRCLVPADAFYEWADRAGLRQPYLVRPGAAGPFGLAGLWARWRGADGAELESCTLLTTAAAPALRDLHDRMPVVVADEDRDAWLDPERPADPALLARLVAHGPTGFAIHPVSAWVNHAEHDDPRCVEPVPEPPRQGSLFG